MLKRKIERLEREIGVSEESRERRQAIIEFFITGNKDALPARCTFEEAKAVISNMKDITRERFPGLALVHDEYQEGRCRAEPWSTFLSQIKASSVPLSIVYDETEPAPKTRKGYRKDFVGPRAGLFRILIICDQEGERQRK